MIGSMLLWFSLSLGLQESLVNINDVGMTKAPLYTQVEMHAENDWLDIYGTYKNEMYKNLDNFYFSPTEDYFTVGAKVKYKNISLKIEHQCIHPVLSKVNSKMLYGGYNKIELSIDSK